MKKIDQQAMKKGEEIAKKYNAETLTPFPFEKIVQNEKNLEGIYYFSEEQMNEIFNENSEDILGFIWYHKSANKFSIFVKKTTAPDSRKYFTIAHELGHFFLHADLVKERNIIKDGDFFIYRKDNQIPTAKETEANHFAGALLMPEERVRQVWNKVKDVDECANFFKVSRTAMSIRLDILNLN